MSSCSTKRWAMIILPLVDGLLCLAHTLCMPAVTRTVSSRCFQVNCYVSCVSSTQLHVLKIDCKIDCELCEVVAHIKLY